MLKLEHYSLLQPTDEVLEMMLFDNKGSSLFIVLIVTILLSLIAGIVVMNSNIDLEISGQSVHDQQAIYQAEKGPEIIVPKIIQYFEEYGRAPDSADLDTFAGSFVDSSIGGGFSVKYWTEWIGPSAHMKQITRGTWKGLSAYITEYRVVSQSEGLLNKARAKVTRIVESNLIPIFQFGIFYDGDIELYPGPAMQMHGRIHTNRNLFFKSSGGISCYQPVTARRGIYTARFELPCADVEADPLNASDCLNYADIGKDKAKIYVNSTTTYIPFEEPSGGDHLRSDWKDYALSRWSTWVKDGAHGVDSLALPINADSAYNIIKRAPNSSDTVSYENKSTLKIILHDDTTLIDSVCWRATKASAWKCESDSPGVSLAKLFLEIDSVIVKRHFWDMREYREINSYDINFLKLNNALSDGKVYFPPNGVMYLWATTLDTCTCKNRTKSCSGLDTLNAFRLCNGHYLYDALTIASENPIYVLGDYNTTNSPNPNYVINPPSSSSTMDTADRKPAAIIADAITFLSRNWAAFRDSFDLIQSRWDNSNSRKVSTSEGKYRFGTFVMAAVILGNAPTINLDYGYSGYDQYSGGPHNLLRFLENWSSVQFVYKGSIVCIWEARQACSRYWCCWPGGNRYVYSPPIRNWSFDLKFRYPENLPPATPMVLAIEKGGWSEQIDF